MATATTTTTTRLVATSRWSEGPLSPVHNSTRHTAAECRKIKKLVEQFCETMQQQRQDGAPSRQREGKQKVDS
jgi:hypothetical protein